MLTGCSAPDFTSILRVIGDAKEGFDIVISYVSGARSSDTGVTRSFSGTAEPVATLRMLVTSPHGKAFSATWLGMGGTMWDPETNGVSFTGAGSGDGFMRTTIATMTSATSTVTAASQAIRARGRDGTGTTCVVETFRSSRLAMGFP